MKIYKTMSSGVIIAEYDASMAASVADMWNKSGDSWGGDSSIMTPAQVIANYSGGSYFNIYAAIDNGEAVGICLFGRYYNDENTAYINLLNVRPDYHGKKVGKELVLACVNKTIELGYPRLDLGTWSGNTKAVPLYKKCGFLWQDDGSSTHLANYIPTVLSTELFESFFETADWYADSTSTREIEIKPDGVKVNRFEVYGYAWEKDGRSLAVGFEKSGRRIRYIETDDYKIELMAENHELAFGLDHSCTFTVTNKSGKELNVKIAGKDDEKGIKFNYSADESIVGTKEFTGSFFVNPIEKDQNTWKMHPCVLADVYVNGRHAEFGLGIEPKYPLNIAIFEKRHGVTRPGIVQDVHINLKNMLPNTAEITFTIPENPLTRFFDNSFTVTAKPEETVTLSLKEEILTCGYAKADIKYDITLDDGRKVAFTKPHHLVNQSVDAVFDYETEHCYAAINGLWKVEVNKQNAYTGFYVGAGSGYAQFRTPKLGKPYSDEFELRVKPSNVKITATGNKSTLDFDLVSETFGVTLTTIMEFTSSGTVSRRMKVTNTTDKTIPELYLQEQYYTSVGERAIFHYDGAYHEVKDRSAYGFDVLDPEKFDENWIFDNSSQVKSGMYWDKDYRPKVKWGDEILFDHETGELAPGAVFETKPCCYMNGVFNNVREFRNYVRGIDETVAPHTVEPLEIAVNGHNPFITTDTNEVKAEIKNHRTKIFGGDIALSSPTLFANDYVQTNPDKELTALNVFNLALNNKPAGIHLIDMEMKFRTEKLHKRALFIADSASKVMTEEKDGILTVTSGKLSFAAHGRASNRP
jgi:Acetyltransferases, including N-acetylases of ribosomal proteins